MNILNRHRINQLIAHRSPLSVSLFMPTERAGRERQQDTIRLKNLLTAARERMLAEGKPPAVVDGVLQPVHELRSDVEFWRSRSEGLACFCAPDLCQVFRVPIQLEEQLFVADRFYVGALLPLLRAGYRFYVLALTLESARLFESTQLAIHEIELPEIPCLDLDGTEQTLQYHGHQAPTRGKGATETAVYHGQGGPTDRVKKDALRFFQLVDRAVLRVLRDQREPLVLACVDYLAPLYESANSYRFLVKNNISGNPERWGEEKLREQAWKCMEPRFLREQTDAWAMFEQAESTHRGSSDLRQVVLAAAKGRVERLFLARGQRRWGHVDPELEAVQILPERSGEELLDFAATRALSSGADVYLLDALPHTDSPAAATFRY